MVYNYTKPRRPIAATFDSPGPCYGLPSLVGHQHHDPRSVHYRGPAYPFGLALNHRASTTVIPTSGHDQPGPASYVPDPKVHRNGRDGTPSFSLLGRHDDLRTAQTPGPGAYAPEHAGPSARRSVTPAYSFGSRSHRRSTCETPAPNHYSVSTMVGRSVQSGKRQAPAYSLSGREQAGSFYVDTQKTPGPGTYVVTDSAVYKTRSPTYSLSGRYNRPSDDTRKPGPGSHSPERVWAHKRESPSFSFGIRHSIYSSPLIINNAVDDY